jgi:hypothetical protein
MLTPSARLLFELRQVVAKAQASVVQPGVSSLYRSRGRRAGPRVGEPMDGAVDP